MIISPWQERGYANTDKRLERIEMIRGQFTHCPNFEEVKDLYLQNKIKSITSVKKRLRDSNWMINLLSTRYEIK